MSWVFFTLLSAFVLALSNVIDKFVLTKWVREPSVPVIIHIAAGLPVSLFIFFLLGFSALPLNLVGLALVAGALHALAVFLYFKAVKIEEISRVVLLAYLTPMFVSFIAAIFLHEIFTLTEYVGIALLIIGAVLVSLREIARVRLGKVFHLMVIASLTFAINAVIIKYLLSFADLWTVFAYVRIGALVALLPLLYHGWTYLHSTVCQHGGKVILVISLNEIILGLGGLLLFTIAVSVGYVTLVEALSSVQPFFVFALSLILSMCYPHILREEIGKATVFQKFVAISLMFVGALMVT